MVAAGKSSFRSTHSKQQLFCRSTVPSNNDTTTGGGDGTLDQTLFYMEDANFNVTGLVNTSGTVVERYAYSPYGQPKFYDGSWNSRTSSNYSIRILYAGYRWIKETGLYDVRHRMYNPSLGKWMQRDPMGYVDGMSLYQYVGSEPVGWVDPWGLASLKPIGGGSGFNFQSPKISLGGGGGYGSLGGSYNFGNGNWNANFGIGGKDWNINGRISPNGSNFGGSGKLSPFGKFSGKIDFDPKGNPDGGSFGFKHLFPGVGTLSGNATFPPQGNPNWNLNFTPQGNPNLSFGLGQYSGPPSYIGPHVTIHF